MGVAGPASCTVTGMKRVLLAGLVAIGLATTPLPGGAAGPQPLQVGLAIKPAGGYCQYTRPTGKELCGLLDAEGAYPVRSGTSFSIRAAAHVAMPPGWRLFIARDMVGPAPGASGHSTCDAVAHRCFPGPPPHRGAFKRPFVCGPTTGASCGPVVVPARRVGAVVYEAFRAVVRMPGGTSFEASFYVKWHP